MLGTLKSSNNLMLIIIIGLFIRVILNNFVDSNDAKSFVIWANFLSHNSVVKLYETLPSDYLPYPPTYYYVLKPIGFILNFFKNSDWISQLIVKLPVFASEVISTVIIYKFTRKLISKKGATISSAFFFLHPAIIYNTSIWGQIDSIIFMLSLAFVVFATLRKELLALIIYLVSVTIKLQALAILPLVAVWSLTSIKILRLRNYSIILILFGSLIFLPLFITKGILWSSKYLYSLPHQYPYTSIYAYNLWASSGFLTPDKVKLLGIIPYRLLGLAAYWTFAALIILPFLKNKNRKPTVILFAAFLLFFDFAFFSTRVHSRYLIYSLPFASVFVFLFPLEITTLSFLIILNLMLPMPYEGLRNVVLFLNQKTTVVTLSLFGLFLFLVFMNKYRKLIQR